MVNILNKGYVSLVLHAHLPFVRHPDSDSYIEERWLFEAISESYIPLLKNFQRLLSEGINFKITMSLTPTLLSMLSDEVLQNKYIRYLEQLIELTEKEIARTKNEPEFNRLAVMYNEKYKSDLYFFREQYKRNIITAFKELQDHGNLEIIACAATHAFLPLLTVNPQSIEAQINIGASIYKRFFNTDPKGMWLPECGYTAHIEGSLRNNGIKYIITESHGVLYADPRPVFATYAPIISPNGTVIFGRDIDSSRQVWSAVDGYPGDVDYREFYRDIGYELDYDYLSQYIPSDGTRISTGVKYYRITGKTSNKSVYVPEWAKSKVEMHSTDFILKRCKQIENFYNETNRPGLIVCPYDAELFGHWWFEGPDWIYTLLKKAADEEILELVSLNEYLISNPVIQVSKPCESTWGEKGYNEVWLNKSNDWIYKHLHKAGTRMAELASKNPGAEGIIKSALNQAARELLLAQSSDWAFIIKTGTMVKYAERRIKEHISNFTRLYNDITKGNIDSNWLSDLEYRNNIFPDIDYKIFGKSH